jgi:(1->4)-alpha-D-glucan 1-alpha-D-glucosylmutase
LISDSDPIIFHLNNIVLLCKKIPNHSEVKSQNSRASLVEEIRNEMNSLHNTDKQFINLIEEFLLKLNAKGSQLSSFDLLHTILNKQPYRLCFWKRASDEINYRRFFDINDLMAIRMENPEVYEQVHQLIFQLFQKGMVTGLRIDHPDGLYNPTEYFTKLQKSIKDILINENRISSTKIEDKPLYLLIEKILEHGEALSEEFEVNGTTGYEYMNQLNGIFVQRENEKVICLII